MSSSLVVLWLNLGQPSSTAGSCRRNVLATNIQDNRGGGNIYHPSGVHDQEVQSEHVVLDGKN